jgi:hypothetical protein
MVLVKVVWSFYFGDASGGLTLLPSAVLGPGGLRRGYPVRRAKVT